MKKLFHNQGLILHFLVENSKKVLKEVAQDISFLGEQQHEMQIPKMWRIVILICHNCGERPKKC